MNLKQLRLYNFYKKGSMQKSLRQLTFRKDFYVQLPERKVPLLAPQKVGSVQSAVGMADLYCLVLVLLNTGSSSVASWVSAFRYTTASVP